ncbi:MAG: alpha/beta fold hydrolase [Kiloniellales bacterium]
MRPADATPAPAILTRDDGATIAYHATGARPGGDLPGVVFLTGLMSDMTGTKALALERFCRHRGQAFLRFDYRGHGASSERFEDTCVGEWADDAIAVIDRLTEGPQVLVGSSLGGWIMLLAALARPARVKGLVGVAAAPDCTEAMWTRMDGQARARIERDGVTHVPSPYHDQPYAISRRLIEEGRRHLVLGAAIPITCPVRLLHGMADADVPWETAIRLAERMTGADVTVTLIKHAGHRLSEPPELARIEAAIAEFDERTTPLS